jgi:hypothetical protein
VLLLVTDVGKAITNTEGGSMTFEEAKQEWPEASLVEDWSFDLETLRRRRLVLAGQAADGGAVVVWEDESL